MKDSSNLFIRTDRRGRLFSILRIVKISLAVALLFTLTECGKDDEYFDESDKEYVTRSMLDEIKSDSLQSYVKWLEGMGTRFALADNHRSVAVRIKDRLISFGYADASLDSFTISRSYKGVTYDQWQYNVKAMIRGTEYPDSVCIAGAHYDDIVGFGGDPLIYAPGAHDNASGTAAMLEIARVLKVKKFTPEKSIMFIAFGAEELGLLGSQYFSLNAGEFTGKIAFMLNSDMIGYDPDNNPTSWKVNIMDYPGSQNLRTDAQKLAQQYTSLGYINDNTDSRRSDSYPFSLRGYKALFFSSVKPDPYYHSNNDVSSNLNYNYCREIAKLSCAIIIDKNF